MADTEYSAAGVSAYPLAWPGGWTRTRYPTYAKFSSNRDGRTSTRVSVPVARERLSGELDRLGARYVTLSTNLELRLDGQPRGGQSEPFDTGVAVYFRLNGKDMVLACDKWNRVADNIVAIAKHIEAMRGMDRWGVGTAKQAFAGYERLAAPEQWWQVLGLPASASPAEIDAAYRAKAKAAHPDVGGSEAAMSRLNAARDQAKAVS